MGFRLNQPSAREAPVTDYQASLLLFVSGNPDVSPYQIDTWIDQGLGGLLGRSAAHMYKEIKRLAELGYLDSDGPEVRPRGRSPKTRYWINKKGNNAIHDWLATTGAVLPATDDSELATRVRGLHVAGPAVVWKGLRDVVFQIDERLELLEDQERALRRNEAWEGSGALEDRLRIGLSRRLLEAYGAWMDDVMRELGQDDPRTDPPRGASARTRSLRRSR